MPAPRSVYGRSKAQAESLILAECDGALLIRSAAFFSPYDQNNFAAWVTSALNKGGPLLCAKDVLVSPTYTPELADRTLDLALDEARGLWHLSNQGALSWSAFAYELAKHMQLPTASIEAASAEQLGWIAPRPKFSALGSERGALMAPLDRAIENFARAVRHTGEGSA